MRNKIIHRAEREARRKEGYEGERDRDQDRECLIHKTNLALDVFLLNKKESLLGLYKGHLNNSISKLLVEDTSTIFFL